MNYSKKLTADNMMSEIWDNDKVLIKFKGRKEDIDSIKYWKDNPYWIYTLPYGEFVREEDLNKRNRSCWKFIDIYEEVKLGDLDVFLIEN